MSVVKDSKFIGQNSVHINNKLTGTNVMPMKAQTSLNSNGYSMMRQIFQNTPKTHPTNDTTKRGQNSLYQDHSLYLLKKKSMATGKQQYSSTLKFNSNPTNDNKNAYKRVRSSGSVAPKKKSL